MHKIYGRLAVITAASLMLAAPLLWYQSVSADQLTTRSVTVSDSLPGATASHAYNFTFPSASSIGSIEFEYCTNTPFVDTPCTAPGGLNAAGASIAAQTGETGFSIDPSSTGNKLVITRAPSITAATPASYVFSNITNQAAANETVYVRISTYSSADASGAYVDYGAVAYATANNVTVTAFVPPYLTFCVGVVVSIDCSTATGSQLSFGELSTTQTRFLTSQFAVATNDPGGYSTTVLGTSLTSGTNVIPALGSPVASQTGTSQFGINLRSNSNPAVGANPTGVGTGAISPSFSIPNAYYFNNQVVASSVKSTDFNVYTVSYIVNISPDQRPGIYTTTLTYVAVAAF